LTEKQQKMSTISSWSSTHLHVKGIVSMAPVRARQTSRRSSFLGASTALDGVYTAFGRVVDGMAAVDSIEAAPRTGETPNERIDLRTVRITQR
jgi:cyclophilin family peptidyl-prolyl cis-trans isomerase